MPDEIDKLIADVVARSPRAAQPEELCSKGDDLLLDERHDAALKCFDKALQIDPRSARAWTGRASVLASKNRRGEALGCVDRALDATASYVPAVALKAELLADVGQHADALACFDAALKAELPAARAAELWGRRARLLVDLGRTDDAIAAYDRALALGDSADVWVSRADLFLQRGDFREVAHCFERAVAADPEHPEAHYRLARARLKLGDRDGARAAFEGFLAIAPERDPRIATAQRGLAELAAATPPPRAPAPAPARVEPATLPSTPAPAGEAELGEPEPSQPSVETVRRLHDEGRDLDALRALGPILRDLQDAPDVWFLRAQILIGLGQTEEAITSLERVTRLDRRHRAGWALMASLWLEMKRRDRALEIADRVVALDPDDPAAHRLRARCLLDLDRKKDARAALEKVVELAERRRSTAVANEARELLEKLG